MPFSLTLPDFVAARARIAPHIKHTPLLTSAQLSELTGFEVRMKAELFQRVGSYKIRGPLNKFALMPEEQKRRGVVCSSAGNHAQGVALAARIHGIRAVVCMAQNATPAKVAATRAYGAEVVFHGNIWDEANEKAKELVRDQGLTYVHPFDDEQLKAGLARPAQDPIEGALPVAARRMVRMDVPVPANAHWFSLQTGIG